MTYKETAKGAAEWAKSKVGCKYSQAQRTAAKIFDCSSLVARAYSALGKLWKWGGSVPTSTNEVYDDDFELLWPATYAKVGKSMGGTGAIAKGKQPGDLQFLCTDSGTNRANKITHVTMVYSATKIVHARGTAYGVRMDDINLYAGKVCAIVRYNPSCALRVGHKGYRTQALQKALNKHGADLSGDGEYGTKTQAAVKAFQASKGLAVTGEADSKTLAALGINAGGETSAPAVVPSDPMKQPPQEPQALEHGIRITGGTVNVRVGPGTEYDEAMVAKAGLTYQEVVTQGWYPILVKGEVRWVSPKMAERF